MTTILSGSLRIGLAVAVLVASGCGGAGGELYVSRRARLTGQVESASRRSGAPCTVTAVVFGHDDAETSTASGRDVSVTVSLRTPLRMREPFRVRVALRVGCEGHRTVTTAERETEVGWLSTPAVDFGRISVPVGH